jgi:hypothetical protein
MTTMEPFVERLADELGDAIVETAFPLADLAATPEERGAAH